VADLRCGRHSLAARLDGCDKGVEIAHMVHETNHNRSSAYTSAMFSETRYALNGDLRVAYRTSREGPRDIVFVPPWLTNCEVFPELPSVQGWAEAMTSLGRLIFFDQPGTGASDPITPGALPTWSSGPTTSAQCWTISKVAKPSCSPAWAR
jgi:hypothetical protein